MSTQTYGIIGLQFPILIYRLVVEQQLLLSNSLDRLYRPQPQTGQGGHSLLFRPGSWHYHGASNVQDYQFIIFLYFIFT